MERAATTASAAQLNEAKKSQTMQFFGFFILWVLKKILINFFKEMCAALIGALAR